MLGFCNFVNLSFAPLNACLLLDMLLFVARWRLLGGVWLFAEFSLGWMLSDLWACRLFGWLLSDLMGLLTVTCVTGFSSFASFWFL